MVHHRDGLVRPGADLGRRGANDGRCGGMDCARHRRGGGAGLPGAAGAVLTPRAVVSRGADG